MENPSELDPLVARLRQRDLSRVVARLVARLRQGRALRGRLNLKAPTEAERRAVAGLSGCSTRGANSISIDLDALAVVATRDGRFASLEQLVEQVHGGALTRQRAEEQASRLEWNQLWHEVGELARDQPGLANWLGSARVRSWIRRLAERDLSRTRRLSRELFTVLRHLPTARPTSLAQLSAEVLGDSHALDHDTRLGRLTVRALAARANRPPPRKAGEVRGLWASASVVLDELSATVLVLNLPARSDASLGGILAGYRSMGEPCRVTFRQLRPEPPCAFELDGGGDVFVCENPAVVAAAADRWGTRCQPLVCVEGQPNLAAERLLHLLTGQGFSLHYHGDFDWGGLRIAARLHELFHFTPWRFTSEDYLAAPRGRPLAGRPATAPWDARLAEAMRSAGAVVHEEAVLEWLLSDLEMERE